MALLENTHTQAFIAHMCGYLHSPKHVYFVHGAQCGCAIHTRAVTHQPHTHSPHPHLHTREILLWMHSTQWNILCGALGQPIPQTVKVLAEPDEIAHKVNTRAWHNFCTGSFRVVHLSDAQHKFHVGVPVRFLLYAIEKLPSHWMKTAVATLHCRCVLLCGCHLDTGLCLTGCVSAGMQCTLSLLIQSVSFSAGIAMDSPGIVTTTHGPVAHTRWQHRPRAYTCVHRQHVVHCMLFSCRDALVRCVHIASWETQIRFVFWNHPTHIVMMHQRT